MQLGDIFRNTVLVTIAGKQLGPRAVHRGIPSGAVRNHNVESRTQWSHVQAESFEGTLQCSERPLYASHGACNPCNLGHDLPVSVQLSFGTSTCTIKAMRSGCRSHCGDDSVPARIATSSSMDRICNRMADTTRPFHRQHAVSS
jgi:hypothetical protein